MSIIAAGTTSNTALVNTGNTDGTLQLQVNGTTPSVTLATTGAIGVGSTPGYGTNGQVLTSSGSSAAPTWTTAGASLTTPSFTSTIGVGGATASASGSGITFPATQSASTNANTLDDYEEGTWTPNIGSLINMTGTASIIHAAYTKIGNKCFMEGALSGLTVTTASAQTSFQVDYPFSAVSAYAVNGTAYSNNGNAGLGAFLATFTAWSAIYFAASAGLQTSGQTFNFGGWITTA